MYSVYIQRKAEGVRLVKAWRVFRSSLALLPALAGPACLVIRRWYLSAIIPFPSLRPSLSHISVRNGVSYLVLNLPQTIGSTQASVFVLQEGLWEKAGESVQILCVGTGH